MDVVDFFGNFQRALGITGPCLIDGQVDLDAGFDESRIEFGRLIVGFFAQIFYRSQGLAQSIKIPGGTLIYCNRTVASDFVHFVFLPHVFDQIERQLERFSCALFVASLGLRASDIGQLTNLRAVVRQFHGLGDFQGLIGPVAGMAGSYARKRCSRLHSTSIGST
jgi:hypothetical protein